MFRKTHCTPICSGQVHKNRRHNFLSGAQTNQAFSVCSSGRLSSLYEDLASLSTAGYSDGLRPSNQKDGGRRREARRQAGELLLRQMIAAGDEARYGCHNSSRILAVDRLRPSHLLHVSIARTERLAEGLAGMDCCYPQVASPMSI